MKIIMEVLKVRPDITTLINNVSQEQEIKTYTITNVETNQKGEGFLGEIFMVTIKDTTSDKELDMVIKAAFINDKIREIAPIRMCFENEVYFYSKVYPQLKKFEKHCGISKTIQYVPKLLMASVDNQHEMLALENLKVLGFEVFDKKSILDHEHINYIFKTYGRFHAYSFALRDQQPNTYSRIVQPLHNIYHEFMKKESFKLHLLEFSKLAKKYLIPGEDDEIIKKYEKYSGDNISDIMKDTTESCHYSAILHGDCWSNNMLFQYENSEDGKKIKDMRLIDWQLIKVGSPACDLSYCLYSGASKKAFDKLDQYLEVYYDSFSSFLKELGSDAEQLFPFATLKEHWKKYAKFGMIMGLSVLKLKLTSKEDVLDFTDALALDGKDLTSASVNVKFDEETYTERVREVLKHLSTIDAL